MRFPDPLGEPSAEGPLPEDRVNPIRKRPDLPDAIAPRDADEDRLVVTPGKELDLTPTNEIGEVANDVRTVRFEPVEQRTGEVEAGFYLGVAIQGGHERGIRPLGHILED